MIAVSLKCFDHACCNAQDRSTFDSAAFLEQLKSGIPLEEHWEFEWTIFRALRAQIGAEDAARKAADDTARQANSGQNVRDGL
jgi:hypothetical protein